MSITKFKTAGITVPVIQQVEVERETEDCVWYMGRRWSKRAAYECFFNSWEDAHAHLMASADAEVLQARRRLQYANDRHGNVKGLKPPKEST